MRRNLILYVLPPALLAGHWLALALLEGRGERWYLSELGTMENLTFVVFVGAGIWGAVLFRRARRDMPRLRWLLLAFALASWFIALEEVSYGQHHLGFATPSWMQAHNKQREMNLHNLGRDQMSRVLRRIAELGLPIFAVILPLALARIPTTYRRGDWTYFYLPRHELMMLMVLCILIRVLHEFEHEAFKRWSVGLSELQEAYWALAGLFWVMVVNERLRGVEAAPATRPAA